MAIRIQVLVVLLLLLLLFFNVSSMLIIFFFYVIGFIQYPFSIFENRGIKITCHGKKCYYGDLGVIRNLQQIFVMRRRERGTGKSMRRRGIKKREEENEKGDKEEGGGEGGGG